MLAGASARVGEDDDSSPSLADVLMIDGGGGFFSFRDTVGGREFVVNGSDLQEKGLEVDLKAFETRVLGDFRAIEVPEKMGWEMVRRAGSRGATSLESLRQEMHLEPLHEAVKRHLSPDLMRRLIEVFEHPDCIGSDDQLLEELRRSSDEMFDEAGEWVDGSRTEAVDETVSDAIFLAVVTLPELTDRLERSRVEEHRAAGLGLRSALTRRPETLAGLYAWLVIDRLTGLETEARSKVETFEAWRLAPLVLKSLIEAGGDPENSGRLVSLIELSLQRGWGRGRAAAQKPADLLRGFLSSDSTRQILGVHPFEGREYFSGDSLESLSDWLLLSQGVAWSASARPGDEIMKAIDNWWKTVEGVNEDARSAEYRTEMFIGRTAPVEKSRSV